MEKSSILIYATEDRITKAEVTFDNDTVWLSLVQIAELFQKISAGVRVNYSLTTTLLWY